jgi:hypothetical protein
VHVTFGTPQLQATTALARSQLARRLQVLSPSVAPMTLTPMDGVGATREEDLSQLIPHGPCAPAEEITPAGFTGSSTRPGVCCWIQTAGTVAPHCTLSPGSTLDGRSAAPDRSSLEELRGPDE